VHSIIFNEDNTSVLGVSSKEGEEVRFKTPVSIAQNPKINDWLTLIEKEIRITLANLLAQSVAESHQFRSGQLDPFMYLNWAGSYQAQIVVLSAQISWSECVDAALKICETRPDLASNSETHPLQAVLSNLKMTQALEARLGGSPFGSAGTRKTESVKALGHQLGQFVLVFNCDETFDFQAMDRIFVALRQVGAWGCFDEFNRLEEKMLSAVSQ